jgi:hypothetical protein
VCQNAEPGVHGHEMDAGPPALGPPLPLADARPRCSGKGSVSDPYLFDTDPDPAF